MRAEYAHAITWQGSVLHYLGSPIAVLKAE